MIIRRLLLTILAVVALGGQAAAQGTFPAPLPNQSAPQGTQGGAPPIGIDRGIGVFPPGTGRAAEPTECLTHYTRLRQDAEQRRSLLNAIRQRGLSRQEICNRLWGYVAAVSVLVSYVVERQSTCNLPAETIGQLRDIQAKSELHANAFCVRDIDQWRLLDPPPIEPGRYRVLHISVEP